MSNNQKINSKIITKIRILAIDQLGKEVFFIIYEKIELLSNELIEN